MQHDVSFNSAQVWHAERASTNLESGRSCAGAGISSSELWVGRGLRSDLAPGPAMLPAARAGAALAYAPQQFRKDREA